MTEAEVRQLIRDELQNILKSDRYVFDKNLQLLDARNIQLGKTSGTKIGTEASQKLGLFGATPVIQASAITAPSGGGSGVSDAIDNSARTTINTIRTVLKNLGITA